jgi:hypothetical protein
MEVYMLGTFIRSLGTMTVVLLLSGGAGVVMAQESYASRITIAAGASHVSHQDLTHTPLVHGGTTPRAPGIRFERIGRWQHFVEASVTSVASRRREPFPVLHGDHGHDTAPHAYVFADASYGVGRRVPAPAGSAAVGAAARLDLHVTDYSYGVEKNFGYFISPSLDVWYRHEIELGSRQRVSARAQAPLVSWVARSPYMVNDDRFIENIASNDPLRIALAFLADGELAGWSRTQRLDLGLDYHYLLSRRLGVGASYRFAFLRDSEPRPLTSVRSSVDLTTSIRF